MFEENRPTCVSVIGWAWIVIGGLMCFAAIMGLLGFLIIDRITQGQMRSPHVWPVLYTIYPFLSVGQIVLGAFGLFSAFRFLRMESWARTALEILSWFLLFCVVGWGIIWVAFAVFGSSVHRLPGPGLLGALMGALISAIYAIPVGIMLKYLRGEKVRNAMTG